jgi:excisionase family DNA binding protein
MPEENYMRTAEAAKYLKVSGDQMENWRYANAGPKYVKIGRIVLYRREDLDAYIAGAVVTPGEAKK